MSSKDTSAAAKCVEWLLSYSLGQGGIRSCHRVDQTCNVVSGKVFPMWTDITAC